MSSKTKRRTSRGPLAAERGRVLEELLGSRARARLLALFLTHPSEEYYVRQVAAQAGLSPGHVHRELTRLARLGLVLSRRAGKEKLYRANTQHPLYPELQRIVYKTAALGDLLRRALGELPGIQAAFIYGSVARGTEGPSSDIDLFILGCPEPAQLDEALGEAEELLGREIDAVTMPVEEWLERLEAREGFVEDVLRSPKIFLVGDAGSVPGVGGRYPGNPGPEARR